MVSEFKQSFQNVRFCQEGTKEEPSSHLKLKENVNFSFRTAVNNYNILHIKTAL